MTDLPTLLYTSTSEIPTFHIPEALKRYPFRAEPTRIGHHKEYPPPPVPVQKLSFQWSRLMADLIPRP